MEQEAREQAFITALVTEHFVLQSARSATVGEANGRASIYLSAVSSALVAFGFMAQVANRLEPFVAAVLPALFILGEFTYIRLVDNGVESLLVLQRIQRIHGYYRGLMPEAEQFFAAPPADDEMVVAVAGTGARMTWMGILFTSGSMIAAVNSILGGAGLALLAERLGGLGTGPAVLVGVAGTLAVFGLHLRYGLRRAATVGLRPQPMRGRARR
jgi:hypothetical protein